MDKARNKINKHLTYSGGDSMNFKFTDNSDVFISAMNEKVKNALFASGAKAERYAKQECPVDTGRLRDSISHQEVKDATYIGTNVEYAPDVEYGSMRNHMASHFLLNSVQNHTEEYKQIIVDSLKN